jgi:glycosyltransferase involved in cell wall biosynthesis
MVTSIHVLGSHQLGGADWFFIRLVEALQRAGHPALAVIRADSPVCQRLSPQIEQLHLPLASKWDLYSRWRLSRLIAERRPDVVQSYMGRATRLTRLPRGSTALHVARLGGYYKIDGYYRHAHAWVGNTRDICDFLLKHGLPRERVFHIGNFVPPPRAVDVQERQALRASLGLPDDAFVIFALGRLVQKKGFQDLLEAFAQLQPQVHGRPLRLLIAGDGGCRDPLRQVSRSLGLEARVHWAGWQNDTTPFFALGDVFVCPSRHEPLGNVILEAWQHGLPVLSTRNEGARELVTDGENALLAPLNDPAGLAEALRRMLALSPADRRRLAEAGHATVQREHSEQGVVAAYLAMYRQLSARR